MRIRIRPARHYCVSLAVAVFYSLQAIHAADSPGLAIPAARRGIVLHVSKLGDNSNGRSWKTAFHTIQTALNAIPDDAGGHRIIVRPDTYAEANLYPAHKGARDSYNVLEGDWDGSFGSGAVGWVVIDSGAPSVIVRTNPKAPTGNPTFMVLPGG
jgi:hypothetical protein